MGKLLLLLFVAAMIAFITSVAKALDSCGRLADYRAELFGVRVDVRLDKTSRVCGRQ